ncbi:MAG: hypothetical protein WCE68_11260 [Anaerolineales bacterium]
MTKIIRNAKRRFARLERGQILVLVAASAIGIIAVVGLSLDVGVMFIGDARLRRAVDAAALAAALQYREGYSITDMTNAADEFLALNGISDATATVDDCATDPSSTTLCTTPPRKLVQVHASAEIPLDFLPVIGINDANVSSTAVSEAASLDVVLAIDRSESMTEGPDYADEYAENDPRRDPWYCNGSPPSPSTDPNYALDQADIGSCQPFDSVINAAVAFTNILVFPYDEVSVITFDNMPHENLSLNNDCPSGIGSCLPTITQTLENLTVFQGGSSNLDQTANPAPPSQYLAPGWGAIYQGPNSPSPSRCYDNRTDAQMNNCSPMICQATPSCTPGTACATSNFKGLEGYHEDPCYAGTASPDPYTDDPATYATTNIGGGLQMAGNEFTNDPRQDTLWVVILLTDGGYGNTGNDNFNNASGNTNYFCPSDTWHRPPNCNEENPLIATKSLRPAEYLDPPTDTLLNPAYDAAAYAYDMADFVGLKYSDTGPSGQGALIYAIGLGPELYKFKQPAYADPYSTPVNTTNEGLGTIFLNYAAHVGNGQAFFAAEPQQLQQIFTLIGSNIAIRLAQ